MNIFRTRQKRERKSVRRKQEENSRWVKMGEDGDSWHMVEIIVSNVKIGEDGDSWDKVEIIMNNVKIGNDGDN